MAYLTNYYQPPQHKQQQTLSIQEHTMGKQLWEVKHINLPYFITTQGETVSTQTLYNPPEGRFLNASLQILTNI